MAVVEVESLTSPGWWKISITIAIVAILYYLRPWLRAVFLAFRLPGPPALPIFGNIFLLKDPKEFMRFGKKVVENYGLLLRGWLSVIPVIVVLDPKHLQLILGSSKLIDKNFFYSLMQNFVGSGLIIQNGNKWKSHRTYIQPYFSSHNLKKLASTFSEGAEVLVQKLRGEEGQEVAITSYINECVLDILHLAILGIPVRDQATKQQSPFRKGHVVFSERILRPWFLLDFLYKFTSAAKHETKQKYTIKEFSRKILEQRKQANRQDKSDEWCLLEKFIEISENNPEFTDDDIVDELCTFMLAGQDSVAAAVSFSLYYLAKHQDVQEKVLEELSEVFKHSSVVNMEALNKMIYLEQCLKEAMRLCPSAPVIARKLSEDVPLGKYVLPAGTNICMAPYATHRIPDYYPNPEKYDPDRFSAERQEKRNCYAYIPFSAGPRNCIGYKFALLEMKTIVSQLLYNYKIILAPEYELQVTFRATLRAKGGIRLKLSSR